MSLSYPSPEPRLLTLSQVEWEDVARDAHFNTPKQARDQWAAIKKKFMATATADGGDGGANDTTEAKKKASPKKRKSGTLIPPFQFGLAPCHIIRLHLMQEILTH